MFSRNGVNQKVFRKNPKPKPPPQNQNPRIEKSLPKNKFYPTLTLKEYSLLESRRCLLVIWLSTVINYLICGKQRLRSHPPEAHPRD
jgi:hypothetical protein